MVYNHGDHKIFKLILVCGNKGYSLQRIKLTKVVSSKISVTIVLFIGHIFDAV